MAEGIDIQYVHAAEISRAIQQKYNFARDEGGLLYYYQDGVYHPGGEAFLKALVKRVICESGFETKWIPKRAEDVVEFIRVDAPYLWSSPPMNDVVVGNGILNLRTRKVRDHSPEMMTTVRLPITYVESATCPAWDKFISQVFPEDTRQLAWEIPAWLMTPDTGIQKAILLYGEGANGKSTYLKAVIAFLGAENVAGLSLQRLEMDRFSVSGLYGKLANICPDLPSHNLENTSMFKAITGGDMITGERKFRDTFTFTPFARLVFSANHLPHSYDGGYAYFRRWNIINFPNQFEGSNAEDPKKLDRRLANPLELSGVLNRALDALPKLRQKTAFSESRSQEQLMQEFEAVSDPFTTWVQRHVHENLRAITPKSAFIRGYNEAHSDKAPLPGITFGLRLQKLFPHLKDIQKMRDGKREWCYEGIEYRA